MNKKMKVIDLFLKIANGEKIPERILFKGIEFIWKNNHYMNKDNKTNLTIDIMNDINLDFEILEDNTEEIEELKRTENVYDMTLECYHDIEKKISNDELADKINEIIRYIKRKDKNND